MSSRLAEYFVVVGYGDRLEPVDSTSPSAPLNPRSFIDNVYKCRVIDRYPLHDYSTVPLPAGIAMFCLPDDIRLTTSPSIPIFYSFAATQQDGTRLYGACLRFVESLPESYVNELNEQDRAAQEYLDQQLLLSPDIARRKQNTAYVGHHHGKIIDDEIQNEDDQQQVRDELLKVQKMIKQYQIQQQRSKDVASHSNDADVLIPTHKISQFLASTPTSPNHLMTQTTQLQTPNIVNSDTPATPSMNGVQFGKEGNIEENGTNIDSPETTATTTSGDASNAINPPNAQLTPRNDTVKVVKLTQPDSAVIVSLSSPSMQSEGGESSNNTQHRNNTKFRQRYSTDKGSVMKGERKVYTPKCICILSMHPFIKQFREFLTELYRISLTPMSVPIERVIMNFMIECPLPPHGLYRVQYNINSRPIIFSRPPVNNPLAFHNFPIKLLFESLDITNVIALFEACLLERRILLLSTKFSLLAIAAEVLTTLMYPFTWQHVYIPLLPKSLLDFLNAPMPLLIGMHNMILGKGTIMSMLPDDMLDDILIVDLDKNHIFTRLNLPQHNRGEILAHHSRTTMGRVDSITIN